MSSYGKSTTGGRFLPKPRGKQVPHAGLYMLAQDGSNVTAWREALYAYARGHFHEVGREFALGKRFVRAKPTLAKLTADHDELTEDSLQILLTKETSEFLGLKRKDKDDEGALFALTEQVTSNEGLTKVKLLGGYNDLLDEQNADGLLKLVISEHTLNVHNISPREATYVAGIRYSRVKQLPN